MLNHAVWKVKMLTDAPAPRVYTDPRTHSDDEAITSEPPEERSARTRTH